MPELILKERIDKLINELMISIELRIKLNEAIVDMQDITQDLNFGNRASETREDFKQLELEENVNQVVEECQETLEKLGLLKMNLPVMDEPKLLYLFNNYSQLSLKKFKEALTAQLALS